jgi:hypothetical protein
VKKQVLSRYAFGCCIAAAMLAGCGGSQPQIGGSGVVPQVPSGTAVVPSHLPKQLTFKFTGQYQTWRVPKNVHSIHVVAFGGAGDGTGGAGLGGRATAILPVQPGEKLTIVVGGNGYKSQGGYNGGGPGGLYATYWGYGWGGGGSTDIREHGSLLSDRIFVVGGGGGQGAYDQYSGQSEGEGGKGGGRIGGSGGTGFGYYGYGGGGGKGGRQRRGGAGGAPGYGTDGTGGSGQLQLGGYGGDGCASCYYSSGGGGGGGGGYYGGGGGGGGAPDETLYCCGGGGGGGGSSYVEATALKYRTWSGWKEATHGLLVLKW